MTAIAALLTLALASQSAARAPVAAIPAGDCELHVWPGEGLTSIFYGLLHGGIVNGGQQGRRGYPRVPPNAMSTAIQTELLAEAQPHQVMNLSGYRLVLHREALSSRTIRTVTGRVSASTSACYAELMVDDVFLQQDWFNGAKLRVLYRYRDFGPGPAPRRSFTTWADSDLDNFPPQNEAALPGALQELRAAFRRTVTVFAAQLQRPPRRH